MPRRKNIQEEVAEVMTTGADTPLGDVAPDEVEPAATEESETGAPVAVGATVERLLMDAGLSYEEVVRFVRDLHAGARTTVRSVASTASVLRRRGVEVPTRRKLPRSR
jgi:hypothetical protein